MRQLNYVIEKLIEIVSTEFPREEQDSILSQLNSLLSSASYAAPENMISFWNELGQLVNGVVPKPDNVYQEYHLNLVAMFMDKTRDDVVDLFKLKVAAPGEPSTVNQEENLPDWFQKPKRFKCPACGCHEGFFGTFTFHSSMSKNPEYAALGYEHGERIGTCNANSHLGNGCKFTWRRSTENDAQYFVK